MQVSARTRSLLDNAAAIWRWWLDEMSGLIPAGWRGGRAGVARIHLASDAVHIDRVVGTEGERFTDGRAWTVLDQESWAQCGELIGPARPVLILDHPYSYNAPLTLPKAARTAFDRAVALQLTEISPLKPEYIVWRSHSVRERDGKLDLKVAMIKRDTIAQLCRIFEMTGRPTPEIHAADGDRSVSLVRAGSIDGGHSWYPTLGLCLLLLLSVPVTTILGASVLDGLNQRQIAGLRARAAPILAAERAEAAAERRRAALARVAAIPVATGLLSDIARTLPRGSAIENIGRDDSGMVSLVITTPNLAQAREAIQQTPSHRLRQTSEETPENGLMRATFRSHP